MNNQPNVILTFPNSKFSSQICWTYLVIFFKKYKIVISSRLVGYSLLCSVVLYGFCLVATYEVSLVCFGRAWNWRHWGMFTVQIDRSLLLCKTQNDRNKMELILTRIANFHNYNFIVWVCCKPIRQITIFYNYNFLSWKFLLHWYFTWAAFKVI